MIVPKLRRLGDVAKTLSKKTKEKLQRKNVKVRQYLSGNIDWIVCIVLGFSIGGLSSLLPQPENSSDEILYLLSAISQVLAALLALVFTITLMFVSMGKKYTLLNKIFNTGTARLMSAFVIGIILPLLLLKVDSNISVYDFLISSSLGLATFCIVAIIPYLGNLNNIIIYDVGIPNLISELNESRAAEEYTRADTAVYDLLDIGKSAIENKREEHTEIIGIQISYFIKSALSRQGGVLPSFSPQISINALSEMGTKAINAQMDRVAAAFLNELKSVSVLLISKGFEDSADEVIFKIQKIGIRAIEHKLIITSNKSLNCLLDIAQEATHLEIDRHHLYDYACDNFGTCAAKFEKYNPEKVAAVCNEIKRKKIDINKILPKDRRDRINKNPELAGFIDQFINRFNSN